MSKIEKREMRAPPGVSTEKFDSCIKKVKSSNPDANAYAVCYNALRQMEKKGLLEYEFETCPKCMKILVEAIAMEKKRYPTESRGVHIIKPAVIEPVEMTEHPRGPGGEGTGGNPPRVEESHGAERGRPRDIDEEPEIPKIETRGGSEHELLRTHTEVEETAGETEAEEEVIEENVAKPKIVEFDRRAHLVDFYHIKKDYGLEDSIKKAGATLRNLEDREKKAREKLRKK